MRFRSPLSAAITIAALALLVALWSFQGDDEAVPPRGGPPGPAGGEGVALLRNRAVPTLGPAAEGGAGQAGSEPTAAAGSAEQTATAGRAGRPQSPDHEAWVASQRALAKTPPAAAAIEQDVPVESEVIGGGLGGVPPEDPVPTFGPDSIYDGLSQDDLVELMVAMRRLRDAGVFVKLSPEQYADVAEILPDVRGVQDADRITQEILGMGVGEWLEHERGPKGRFILH